MSYFVNGVEVETERKTVSIGEKVNPNLVSYGCSNPKINNEGNIDYQSLASDDSYEILTV